MPAIWSRLLSRPLSSVSGRSLILSLCHLRRCNVPAAQQQLRSLSTSSPPLCFGRNKMPNMYGHRSIYVPFKFVLLFFMLAVPLNAPFINWGYFEEEHGIVVPFITEFYRTTSEGTILPYHPDGGAKFASSEATHLEDNAQEVHDFMMRQAEERGKKKYEQMVEEEKKKTEKSRFLDMVSKGGQVKAESMPDQEEEDSPVNEEDIKKEGGFRQRKIIEYENRIRQYSTPDKVFRYFATYRVTDEKGQTEVMMTPEDFVRSITPGMKQPESFGLDQFNHISTNSVEKLSVGVEESSIFHRLGSGGLITFSDYIFLLTVLSTSRRHFEIAFKMFDLNGDGNVDAREFGTVTNLMKSQSSMGARHRDHQNTGSTFKGINSGLISFFFGPDSEGFLTVDKFLEFQRHLQNEILALEFKRKISDEKDSEELISEKGFAELLITYAGFHPKKKTKMLKRVKREFGKDLSGENAKGITLEEYQNFYQVLYSINDIDTALTFYHIAGAPIERNTMKHVARTVANVELSDHLINVVFVLFDENGDGKLSNKEFVSVMKQRAMRGLEKPKDTGLGKIFGALMKCAKDVPPTVLGGMKN